MREYGIKFIIYFVVTFALAALLRWIKPEYSSFACALFGGVISELAIFIRGEYFAAWFIDKYAIVAWNVGIIIGFLFAWFCLA